MPKPQLKHLLHVSVLISDLERSLHFYQDILGLDVDPQRPDLGFPGAWLNLSGGQIHLLQLENPDPVTDRPAHGGRDRHFAVSVDNLSDIKIKLNSHGVRYTESKSGRLALFVRDPDGNAVELIED